MDFKEELVLLALQDKELYGVQIAKLIDEQSEGKHVFYIGTLYPVLTSLENKGYITSGYGNETPKELQDRGGARRRYYKITESGIRALENLALKANLADWTLEPC